MEWYHLSSKTLKCCGNTSNRKVFSTSMELIGKGNSHRQKEFGHQNSTATHGNWDIACSLCLQFLDQFQPLRVPSQACKPVRHFFYPQSQRPTISPQECPC